MLSLDITGTLHGSYSKLRQTTQLLKNTDSQKSDISDTIKTNWCGRGGVGVGVGVGGVDGSRTGRGSASGQVRSKSPAWESLIVCARTVQAVRDRNACVTTETERRNPQTDLAECAPMRTEQVVDTPTDAVTSCSQDTLACYTHNASASSEWAALGARFCVCARVCVIQDDKNQLLHRNCSFPNSKKHKPLPMLS